jgi:hypothetical protein
MLMIGVPLRLYTTPWAFGVCDYYGPQLPRHSACSSRRSPPLARP